MGKKREKEGYFRNRLSHLQDKLSTIVNQISVTESGNNGDNSESPMNSPNESKNSAKASTFRGPEQEAFVRLTQMASRVLQTPVVSISFLTKNGVTAKSVTDPQNFFRKECNKKVARKLCTGTIQHAQTSIKNIISPDYYKDITTDDPKLDIKSYAGIPLIISGKKAFGCFSVWDTKEREWSETDLTNLNDLASLAMTEIELALDIADRKELEKLVENTSKLAKLGGWEIDLKNLDMSWTPQTYRIHELPVNTSIDMDKALEYYIPAHRPEVREAITNILENGEPFEREFKLITEKGHPIWVKLLGDMESVNGNPTKIKGSIQDITNRKKAELQIDHFMSGLKALNNIFASPEMDFNQQLDLALEQVTDFINLDIGIISEIRDNKYRVEHVSKNIEVPIEAGDAYELADTYCDITYTQNDVVALKDVKNTRYTGHPCYKNFGLESYIGAPIRVSGERYGTLNFSSPNVRKEEFSEQDLEFVRLLAKWTGSIMERKQSALALKRSEQKFRGVFENAAVGIALVDMDGNIQRTNPSLSQMLGYTSDELENLSFLEITHPDDQEIDYKRYQSLVNNETDYYQLEKRYLRKDGEIIWGRLTVSMIFDNNEDPVYAIGMVENINSRKKTELALRKSEEEYRNLFKNAIEGIYQSTPEGKLVNANPAMAQIVGYESPEELLSNIRDITTQLYVDPKDREKLQQLLRDEGEVKNFETKIYRKDGSKIWISISTRLITNRDGQQLYEGTIENITQRKQAENQLREAKEIAEAANRAKSEFLANVSHEIRTPMNSVLGFSEILSETVDNPTQQKYIDAITSSGKNLLNLINDILDLSKIEAGRLELEYQPVNIHNILDEIRNIFSLKIEEKELNFTLDIDPQIPNALLMDEIRLRQILLNLVGNAVKFTDEGGVTVSARQLNKDNDQKTVDLHLSVKDTGVGIPKDQQHQIFESFRQQSGQSSRKYGGTGLGLAISKRLVEKMGGELSLESKVGKGSSFNIVMREVQITKAHKQKEDKELNNEEITFGDATVLVVDDVKLNNELIRRYLEKTGLNVLSAKNGVEACEMAQEHIPDLILMDIKMPEMDGFEATRKIKSMQSTARIPILALTASVVEMPGAKVDREIFDGFLEKPIKKNLVLQALAEHLVNSDSENTSGDDQESEAVEIPQTGDIEITQELKNNREEAEQLLKEELLKQAEVLSQSLIIGHIKEFAGTIDEAAERYDLSILKNYARGLQNSAENFDVEALSENLEKYPKLVTSIFKKL